MSNAAAARPSSPSTSSRLLELHAQMLLIRAFEAEAERQYKLARIGGYCHLSIGQEAACVGAVAAMEPNDLLITGYRAHGLALARGLSPEAVMAELFGRVDGCAGGRGGSMHLLDWRRGYYGGWGIVGGQLPIATGMALALVRQDRPQAVLCELGDGAVNIGAFHEALNLAGLWDLPVVFVIANNSYAMGTSVDRASAEPELFRRAAAYRIESVRIDGDDLEQVIETTSVLLDAARTLRRPAVVEMLTYRHRGHSVADAGLSYRDRDEIEEHKRQDPISRVRDRLIAEGVEPALLAEQAQATHKRVDAAVEYALASPEPPLRDLARGMYADGSDEQFAPMRAGSAFGEVQLVFEGGLGRGEATYEGGLGI